MKLVINKCFGGFSLSPKVAALMGDGFNNGRSCVRNDPKLIKLVEKFKDKANGPHAKLKIAEIPDDVEWQIIEYDGMEHIAEVHRIWE